MTKQNNLSARETEILKLVAKGLTNREIAQQLTISPNTVKVHLSNIFEKISVASRTEATMYGIEHGIVDVPGGAEAPSMEPAGWRTTLRRFAWFLIPVILLILALLVAFTINALRPPPAPETQIATELAERWQELAPMPAPRAAMAAAAYDGEIYAIAGEGPEGVSGSTFRYTPETDSWSQLSDKPTPVADVHGALIGEKIYVPGGRLAVGGTTDILEIYDPRRDTWSTGARLPQAVSAYALEDFEGQMYLFGGWDGQAALDVVYIYDPGSDTWREGTRMATARRDAGAVSLADKIIVMGGRNDGGALTEAVSYFPSRDAGVEDPWEGFVELPEARYGFGVANISDVIFLLGGSIINGSAGNELLSYQFISQIWQPFIIFQFHELRQPVLIPVGSQIFTLSYEEVEMKTPLRVYQAYFYEIFFPIIK